MAVEESPAPPGRERAAAPASRPQASVVIATFERRAILERTLAALASQLEDGDEVIVVDDASSDGTWSWLTACGGRLGSVPLRTFRQDPNQGQGRARNRAVESAGGDVVLFLGDDVIPAPGWLEAHLEAHRGSGGPTAVVGLTEWRRAEMRVTPALEMAAREGHQFGYGHMEPGREVPFTCFYTSNLSAPRRVLGEEPFDPSFSAYGWEDVELGYRLAGQGVPLVYRPEARAEHLHPMTLRDLFQRQRQVGRSWHSLVALHPEIATSPLLAPPRPPRWYPLARRIVPVIVPVLSRIDRLGVGLGTPLLHRVLSTGYYLGKEEG